MVRTAVKQPLRRQVIVLILAGMGAIGFATLLWFSYIRPGADLLYVENDDGTWARILLFNGRICGLRTVQSGGPLSNTFWESNPDTEFRGLMQGIGGGGFMGFYWYETPVVSLDSPNFQYVKTYQRLDLPLWLPILISGTLIVVFCVRAWRSLTVRYLAICSICSYDLRGNVSGRCPECGTPIENRKPSYPTWSH